MDEDGHGLRAQTEALGSLRVVDLLHVADLDEVVARADRTDLSPAALHGPVADDVGVRPFERPAALDVIEVVRGAVPLVDRPGRAPRQDLADGRRAERGAPVPGTDAGRHVPHDLVHQALEARPQLVCRDLGAEEPDAAVDVVADAPRAHDPALIRVERRDAADREAVTPVNVRHADGPANDARQARDVRHLPNRLVAPDVLHQPPVRVDEALHPHLAPSRKQPPVLVELPDLDRIRCRR